MHGNNLRHRAVHILIFNHRGELFLQKRSRWKDRHPLLWDSSAAGHVEAGEEYDKTAIRELEEELGVKAELTRVAKLPCQENTGWEFIWLYRGEHGGPFQLAKAEIEYGEFFPTDVVSGWVKARPDDFAPGFLECWKAFKNVEARVPGAERTKRPNEQTGALPKRLYISYLRARVFLPAVRFLPRTFFAPAGPRNTRSGKSPIADFRNFRAARRAPSFPP